MTKSGKSDDDTYKLEMKTNFRVRNKKTREKSSDRKSQKYEKLAICKNGRRAVIGSHENTKN
jgi:hypothetical protein